MSHANTAALPSNHFRLDPLFKLHLALAARAALFLPNTTDSLHHRQHSLTRHSITAELPFDYYRLDALFDSEFDFVLAERP